MLLDFARISHNVAACVEGRAQEDGHEEVVKSSACGLDFVLISFALSLGLEHKPKAIFDIVNIIFCYWTPHSLMPMSQCLYWLRAPRPHQSSC